VPGVLSAYAAQGLRLDRRLDLDGWAVLVLARGGRSPRPLR
jgi:ribosomal protein L11 methyltransferase